MPPRTSLSEGDSHLAAKEAAANHNHSLRLLVPRHLIQPPEIGRLHTRRASMVTRTCIGSGLNTDTYRSEQSDLRLDIGWGTVKDREAAGMASGRYEELLVRHCRRESRRPVAYTIRIPHPAHTQTQTHTRVAIRQGQHLFLRIQRVDLRR